MGMLVDWQFFTKHAYTNIIEDTNMVKTKLRIALPKWRNTSPPFKHVVCPAVCSSDSWFILHVDDSTTSLYLSCLSCVNLCTWRYSPNWVPYCAVAAFSYELQPQYEGHYSSYFTFLQYSIIIIVLPLVDNKYMLTDGILPKLPA